MLSMLRAAPALTSAAATSVNQASRRLELVLERADLQPQPVGAIRQRGAAELHARVRHRAAKRTFRRPDRNLSLV
jgi:hypothetical protein